MTEDDKAALLRWAEAGRVQPEVLAELLRRSVSYGEES